MTIGNYTLTPPIRMQQGARGDWREVEEMDIEESNLVLRVDGKQFILQFKTPSEQMRVAVALLGQLPALEIANDVVQLRKLKKFMDMVGAVDG